MVETRVDDRRQRVGERARVAQAVHVDDDEIGRLPLLDRAALVTSENVGAAAGGQPDHALGRDRLRPVGQELDEKTVLELSEHVGRVVARAPVDGETHAHALSSISGTFATPDDRRMFDVGQCATPVPVAASSSQFVGLEVDAVREPDVPAHPAEVLHDRERPLPVGLEAVRVSSAVSARCV